MSCLADAGDPNERYQQFLRVGKPQFKCLIESTLLFDQIVIPTNDFMPLSLMAGVLGERALLRLLDEDTVRFARFRGSLGYLGNGGGITVFQVGSAVQNVPKYFSAPLDEATRAAIEAVNANLDKKKLAELTTRATAEFSIEVEELRTMTYGQIKKSPEVIKAKGLVDVRRLKGIQPNQVRLLSGVLQEGQNDDIFQVLRVAQACVEVKAAANTDCDDIYTSDQVSELFRGALTRATGSAHPGNAYVELRELADLPDVGELVLQDTGLLESVLKLRNSTAGAQFRGWFQENVRTDPTNVAREYAKLLQEVPGIQSATGRTIRFLAQVGVGAASAIALDAAVGFAASMAAGAIDSFLVDRMFGGSSPKVFLERLQKLAAAQTKK